MSAQRKQPSEKDNVMNLNKQNTLLLIIGSILLAIGILKPNFSNIINRPKPSPVVIDDVEIEKPTGELLVKSNEVIKSLLVNNDRKIDGLKLASLYKDIAHIIELDGDDEVVKSTEEIRQINRLSGVMVDLNIKDKYPDLAETAHALIVEAVSDDNVLLNKELRENAVKGFKALSWACKEGSK